MRATRLLALKHRPKGVPTEVGSNRYPDEKYMTAAKAAFARPEFPRKTVVHNWRFFLRPGKATTGSALGQEFTKLGLKAMDFVKLFNDKTKPHFKDDSELTCRVQVYHDKTFTWMLEPPPTTWFLLRAIRKKRRETGPVQMRGTYCAYLTMEMVYEIAKHKWFNFGADEDPPIEVRARQIAIQARRMGIALIGVDGPNSPIKGMTAAQYEKQAAKYREEQTAQHQDLEQKRLEKQPLIERLHRPDVARLDYPALAEGLKNPELATALWKATAPKSRYLHDIKERRAAQQLLENAGWIAKDMSADELRAFFLNWRLPSAERARHLNGFEEAEAADVMWTREGAAAAEAAANARKSPAP